MKQNNRLTNLKEFRIYRRHLPHIEQAGNIYFITFHTTNDLFLPDAAKDIVFSAIRFHDHKMYQLHACVVMDTHVHCILQPLEKPEQASLPVLPTVYFSLAQICHSIKSYSANRLQRLLNIEGSSWLNESYDRVIRDEKEYTEKMNYIINNPMKAGLVEKPEDYKWLFYEEM